MLLNEYLKKNVLLNDDDDTKVFSTRKDIPPKHTTPPAPVVLTQAQTHDEGRLAENAKAIRILTHEVSVAAQRQSVFERLSEKKMIAL